MANVSVPNRIKPITLLAHEAALNDWLSIRGFHDGPSVVRSPKAEYTTATDFIPNSAFADQLVHLCEEPPVHVCDPLS